MRSSTPCVLPSQLISSSLHSVQNDLTLVTSLLSSKPYKTPHFTQNRIPGCNADLKGCMIVPRAVLCSLITYHSHLDRCLLATFSSKLDLEHTKHAPTSGPLHFQFSLLRTIHPPRPPRYVLPLLPSGL